MLTADRTAAPADSEAHLAARCPACDSVDFGETLTEVRDHFTLDSFRILHCRRCDVRFTWPAPVNLDRYYPSAYRAYRGVTKAVLQALYRRRVRTWVRGAAPGHALEIGCGRGLMLDALRHRGWRVTGVERTEEMAAYARHELGLDVIAGGVEEVPADSRFDLIILFQVLEHMRDPKATLRHCAARLKPGGRVIVSVPNLDSWQARFAGPYWVHLDPPRHLVHFTPSALERMFGEVGLMVSDVRFASLEHDPYGWVQSAISRLTGNMHVFTRFLMGLEPVRRQVLVDAALAAVLAAPALILAFASWPAQRGALMEMTAVRPPRQVP